MFFLENRSGQATAARYSKHNILLQLHGFVNYWGCCQMMNFCLYQTLIVFDKSVQSQIVL